MRVNQYLNTNNQVYKAQTKRAGGTKTATGSQSSGGRSFDDLILHEQKHKAEVVKKSDNALFCNTDRVNVNHDWIQGLSADKGTAAHTTVYVDRNAYDKIVNATTYKDRQPDWEEIGCDGEKRWVVINGQRFECPLSQAEKNQRKRMQGSYDDLLDALIKNSHKHNVDKNHDFRGNIESLKSNEKVVQLLHGIFGTSSFDDLLMQLSGSMLGGNTRK